jgi:hypothetical protein
MSLRKLGNALIQSDRVLAMRPTGDQIKSVEVAFDTGERILLNHENPAAAIESYFLDSDGRTAPRSMELLSTGATNKTSDVDR